MVASEGVRSTHERWSHLRFAIVGPLLAAPPAHGELMGEITALSRKAWTHPTTGESTRFSISTIERWYYAARRATSDPVASLRKKVRVDKGRADSMAATLKAALVAQHREHPGWSVRLHVDNLGALAASDKALDRVPSYSTVRRFMKASGLFRRRRSPLLATLGEERARDRLEEREVRSYESEHVHGLWHLDFHEGSRKVVTEDGRFVTPILLGVIDDRSRLCCHLQWYEDETARSLVHGLSQAIQKRGLPRSLLTDNGAAMLAAETREGLARLSILHETTLPYSPYQNGKQEVFWAQVEGRLIAMLEGCPEVTLSLLNEATQAWVEGDDHRRVHSEIATTPLARASSGPWVDRTSPSSEALRFAFTTASVRTQRRSDGTVSIEGRRFEVVGRLRHMERLTLRYARWDLSAVWAVDATTGAVLARLYPQDKARNADGLRRALASHLRHAMTAAGAAQLMTKELVTTLCEHAAGNLRLLMTMANDLLDAGVRAEGRVLDEKLYFDTFVTPTTKASARAKAVEPVKRAR